MNAYFDSAIIVKLYVSEATSADAIRLVAAYVAPYWLTEWQELEVKNAIRLKAFRKEITAVEMNQSIAALNQDVKTGRWQRPIYVAGSVKSKAEELSAVHASVIGCRTIDIIHVAAAIIIGVQEFVTFDKRQVAMAKQAGLKVKP